jgi:DNA-binding NarL/FixJ family response regulator
VFVRNLVRAGCSGFINDEVTQEGLSEALDTVMEGKLWIDRGLLSQIAVEGFELQCMIEQLIRERIGLLNEELSAREADVFSLALDGLSTQEVADTLHLSKQSVKVYLHRLFLKFGVNNRAKLIVAAFVRVCPVDHLIQLLRRNLDHTDTWRRSYAREAQSPEERAEP